MTPNVLTAPPAGQPAAPSTPPLETDLHAVLAAAWAAARLIPPLWPLRNFVAVNPFLGLSDVPFHEASRLHARLLEDGMLMRPSYYRAKMDSGEIAASDLAASLQSAARHLSPEDLAGLHSVDAVQNALLEMADPEAAPATDPAADAVVESISHFCAAYFDSGQSIWRAPWRNLPLYAAWLEFAHADPGPERSGIRGFRSWVRQLSPTPEGLLAAWVPRLAGEPGRWADYLHGLLLTVRGWAGHVRYRQWESELHGGTENRLLELLAIRLGCEAAVQSLTGRPAWNLQSSTPASTHRTTVLFLLQMADEHAWQRRLFRAIQPARISSSARRPAAQAVFCIDIRSEPFRRSLEAVAPSVETRGFAGFFGVALEYLPLGLRKGTARCPVLLKPVHRVREGVPEESASEEDILLRKRRIGRRISHAWNAFRSSAISCFSFVETTGLAYGLDLLRAGFARAADPAPAGAGMEPILARHEGVPGGVGIALGERIQIARGFLKNLGLREGFARLVLICGHGSATVNNPYGSGLDCGACGGHSGDANARVCAAILNDPSVRSVLASEGTPVPPDTWFVAGLHNTTTDDVTLLDTHRIPLSHRDDVEQLAAWLALAGKDTRKLRAPKLGLDPRSPHLDTAIRSRSTDWSQVRPEWGLAGNAAFLAAPRSRSLGSDLGGRVFLHDYEWNADPDASVLELILTAPVVVASWINLQYFGSTTNPAAFGSGNKVLHNVVGTLGVCLGNGGDLQPGLPLQSVHDGTRWMHDPVRLHVLIEAPRERIDTILAKHPAVDALVKNSWILLFALDPTSGQIDRRVPGGVWRNAGQAGKE